MTIYANNVAGTLAANIGPSDTLVLLGAGQGAKFPSPTGGNYFYATLVHVTTGVVEIVQCTARSVDTLTVVRGRDGTTATSFTTGSVVEMRLCAIMLTELDYKAARGVANGLASLDASGKVPDTQIPDSITRDTELTSGLATKQNALGYTPVQQGTGVGQLSNVVKIGWASGSKTKITIDSTDQGNIAMESWVTGLRGAANGLASLDASTKVPVAQIPALAYLPTSGGTISGSLTVTGNTTTQGNNDANSQSSQQDFFTTSANVVLAPNGAGWVYLRPNGRASATNQAMLDSSGLLTVVNVSSTSDRRLKESIEPRKTARGFADKIALYDWSWIEDGKLGTGVIAQDVEDFAPGYVYGSTTLSVDKAGLALEAIVDLAARVRQLEERAQHA